MSCAPPPLRLVDNYQGRGRALIASRRVNAGEVLLTDSPILLYPATPSPSPTFCSRCFRTLNPASHPHLPCPNRCTFAIFCSSHCLSISLSSSHTPWLCQALSHLHSSSAPHLRPELLVQAYFLLAAYNLAAISPTDFHLLLSLQGSGRVEEAAAMTLHCLISTLSPPATQFGLSLELTTALLVKDKTNAFALMKQVGEGGERSARAYGIYPKASFFNHDCLPNACRFDYTEREGDQNIEIIMRAIHEISEGREVCLSYFPVTWGYKERQKRLLEDYGFQCRCDRCEVEKNWKDEDEEDGGWMEEKGSDEGMQCLEEEEDGDFPHAYFFVKFVCSRENCGGTLAPLPPSPEGATSNVMECNVCGQLGNEEDDNAIADDEEEDGVMLDD